MKKFLKTIPLLFIPFSLFACKGSESSKEVSNTQDASIALYHHVTFLNDDNAKLLEIDVLDGETAVYSGDTPAKAEDDEFTYEFKGWDKDLTNVKSDITTKALYDAIPKENWGSIEWF